MGKNCMLQDDLWCGTGVPPVVHHCGCQNEVSKFKDVKCVGDNVYSCTGTVLIILHESYSDDSYTSLNCQKLILLKSAKINTQKVTTAKL